MAKVGSAGDWSDQVHDSVASNNRATRAIKDVETKYAISWGEGIEITDDFMAQICPADLANHVCDFDYVMPNGCDHNCEMLRLCQVYVAHCGYECPNTDEDNLKCPYVHGVMISCSSVNYQSTVHNEKRAMDDPFGASWEATAAELKKEEKNKKKGKAAKDRFTCTMKIADDCQRAHDHQAARLASHALLQKHQHAGRIVHGLETETFNEKATREAEQPGNPSTNNKKGKGTPLPEDAKPTLMVQSLAYTTTADHLKAAFEKYGDIKRISVPTKDDGTSRGTGFIDFSNIEHAAAAHAEMQGVTLNGRVVRVKFMGDKSDGQGKSQGGGGSRACFTCQQEGHMSRDCPSKVSNQGGGGNVYGNSTSQIQNVGKGWGDSCGETIGGGGWDNAGGTIAQGPTTDWDTAATTHYKLRLAGRVCLANRLWGDGHSSSGFQCSCSD